MTRARSLAAIVRNAHRRIAERRLGLDDWKLRLAHLMRVEGWKA